MANRTFYWSADIDGDMNKPGNYRMSDGSPAAELPGQNWPTNADTLLFDDPLPGGGSAATPPQTGPTPGNAMTLAALRSTEAFYWLCMGGHQLIFANMTVKGNAELFGAFMGGGVVEGNLDLWMSEDGLNGGTVYGSVGAAYGARVNGGNVSGDLYLWDGELWGGTVGGTVYADGDSDVCGGSAARIVCIDCFVFYGTFTEAYIEGFEAVWDGGQCTTMWVNVAGYVGSGQASTVYVFAVNAEIQGGMWAGTVYCHVSCKLAQMVWALATVYLMSPEVVVTDLDFNAPLPNAKKVRRGVSQLGGAAMQLR